MKREWVEGVYWEETAKAEEYRKIGLWLVEHQGEFKDVKKDLVKKVAKASGFDMKKVVIVVRMCTLYGKRQKEQATR